MPHKKGIKVLGRVYLLFLWLVCTYKASNDSKLTLNKDLKDIWLALKSKHKVNQVQQFINISKQVHNSGNGTMVLFT